MLKNKKIIVTGGKGFIGSHLVDRLIKQENIVTIIDDESVDSNWINYKNNKANYTSYNICDYEYIKHLFKDVDYVYHLAAESRIQPTLENPILATLTNAVGTCTILQCAKEAGVKRVIYSSTSSAYGLKNKIPLKEDMPIDCLNPYSVSKTSGEELCKMYTKLFGLETVIFRYFNVYGDRQPLKGQYAPVIGLFLEQKKNNKPLTIVGNGKQKRDFTHVSDIVEANIRAATYNDIIGEIINVGTGINYSINDIAKLVGGKFINIEERLGESKISQACTKKIQKLLKFKPNNKIINYIKNGK
jgi:UDP-glucose 4-epimerase